MKKKWVTVTSCRICSSNQLTEILDLGNQPPANSLYSSSESPPMKIPLRTLFCNDCKSLQLGESVNPEFLFGKYLWVTGTSRTAFKYSKLFAERALKKITSDDPFIVEIASNDGTFLKEFKRNNCEVLGIDPAKNIAKLAISEGIPTEIEFFNKDIADYILKYRRPADIAIARNVIPHVKEIHSVIYGLKTLISTNGVGVIEFHDSSLLLQEIQYDYIYHEHLFYFTLYSIQNLLKQYDLYVFDVERSPISGGSWVIFFSSTKKDKSERLERAEKLEDENKINHLKSWIEFGEKAKSHRDQLKDLIKEIGKPIIAYGASARSSTLLNFAGITTHEIYAIIDRNSLKHNLITPGTGVPVVSFEEGIEMLKNIDRILLLAWNFIDEIVGDLRQHGYIGKFIQPLPGLPKIL